MSTYKKANLRCLTNYLKKQKIQSKRAITKQSREIAEFSSCSHPPLLVNLAHTRLPIFSQIGINYKTTRQLSIDEHTLFQILGSVKVVFHWLIFQGGFTSLYGNGPSSMIDLQQYCMTVWPTNPNNREEGKLS